MPILHCVAFFKYTYIGSFMSMERNIITWQMQHNVDCGKDVALVFKRNQRKYLANATHCGKRMRKRDVATRTNSPFNREYRM